MTHSIFLSRRHRLRETHEQSASPRRFSKQSCVVMPYSCLTLFICPATTRLPKWGPFSDNRRPTNATPLGTQALNNVVSTLLMLTQRWSDVARSISWMLICGVFFTLLQLVHSVHSHRITSRTWPPTKSTRCWFYRQELRSVCSIITKARMLS